MQMSEKEYAKFVKDRAPKSKTLRDTLIAFAVGGGICVLGQALGDLYAALRVPEQAAQTLATVSLIFLSGLLTALHVYDDMAKHAGAGLIVPITGFANSVVSPAMEYKTEGLVLGLGSKMFSVAGPVLAYGITASVLYGIILFIFS